MDAKLFLGFFFTIALMVLALFCLVQARYVVTFGALVLGMLVMVFTVSTRSFQSENSCTISALAGCVVGWVLSVLGLMFFLTS